MRCQLGSTPILPAAAFSPSPEFDSYRFHAEFVEFLLGDQEILDESNGLENYHNIKRYSISWFV
jgi:hypothetical protein